VIETVMEVAASFNFNGFKFIKTSTIIARLTKRFIVLNGKN
jgi:hypothetical protein